MKFKILIASAAMVLLTVASAFATGYSYMPSGAGLPGAAAVSNTPTVHGSISSTAAVINVSGNKATFSPYRDLTQGGGLFSNINLGYDSNNYWLQLNANDIGYKDQSYYLNGGAYDKYSFGLFYNQILHNITFGAISPFAGVGSTNLVAGSAGLIWSAANLPTNTAQWPTTFNYFTQRNQAGGNLSVNLPYDLTANFSVTNEHKTGTYPMGGIYIEVPAPIDWVTQDYNASLEYHAKPLFAQANLQYSDFTNHDEDINFQVPNGTFSSGGSDLLSMPMDNNFLKGSLQASLELPFYSHFNVDMGTSQYKSSADLAFSNDFRGSPLATTDGHYIAGLSSTTFNGKRNVSNVYVTLTSNPVPFLDGRLFYKYFDSTNNSQNLLVTTGTGADNGSTPVAPLVFDYNTNTYGVNLGFALPAKFHLDTEYELVHTERPNASLPVPNTNDNTYFAEIRWNGLDWITPRVSFRDFNRNGGHLLPPNDDKADHDYDTTMPYYQEMEWFNVAAQHTKDYKAEVDITPIDALEVDLQYHYIDTNYPDNIIGLLSSRTNEADVDASYSVGTIGRINGYWDLENIKTDTFFNINNTSNSVATSPESATNYNVDESVKDNEYEFGAGAEVYVIPGKLTFNIRYDYMNSDGFDDVNILTTAALSSLGRTSGGKFLGTFPANATSSELGMPYDSYKDSAINANLTYNFTARLALTGGVEFDHYTYNDSAVNDYQNVFYNNTYNPQGNNPPTTTGVGGGQIGPYLLGGAYSSPSYNANVEFLTLAYKF